MPTRLQFGTRYSCCVPPSCLDDHRRHRRSRKHSAANTQTATKITNERAPAQSTSNNLRSTRRNGAYLQRLWSLHPPSHRTTTSTDASLNEHQPTVLPSAHQPGTVHIERKICRPKLPSLYVEPDLGSDLLDGMELIFNDYGHSIRKAIDPLAARTDSIAFYPPVHQSEFDLIMRWGLYPVEH